MNPPNAQREFALEVVRTLRDAGHEALWAGGCVRDQLLGREPKDYDVATDALPERVREVFGTRRTIAVGAAFGVIVVLGPKRAGQIDVATFRADLSYSDGRRPDAVRYTTPVEDASRRDFTINGLFYDPITERVIDHVGGEPDLQARVLRAIGDPHARFAEDRLRMLRAARFAATLRLEIDPATAQAVRAHADAITEVSPERIGVEMRKMLSDANRAVALELLTSLELLPHVLLPLAEADGEAVRAAIARLARLEEASAPLALATALTGVMEHTRVASLCRSLRWTNDEAQRAAWLIEHHGSLDRAHQRPWSDVQPILAHAGASDLVALRAADLGSHDAADAFCRDRLALSPEQLDPPPLIEGADLIAAGRTPGPEFKELLLRARRAQLDGEANTKAEALRLLGLLSP